MAKRLSKLILFPNFMTNYIALSIYKNDLFLEKNTYMDDKGCNLPSHLRTGIQELPAKRIKTDEYLDVEGIDVREPKERQGYYEPDVKPNIQKNVQLQCPIPGQHPMEPKQGYFYPAGGNHQVPGEDEQMAYDSNSNEFYELPKHTEELYQQTPNGYPNPQALHLPISECSSTSLPLPLTPYSIPTTGSAPTSPSVGYEVGAQYMNSSASPDYQDQMISPFQYSMSGGNSFQYPDSMQMTPTRMSMKDPKYCERRRKNNEASKKSRAKKKEKAKEMESRAHVLEEENRLLRVRKNELEQDLVGYKQLIEKIQASDHMECNTAAIQAFHQRKEHQLVAPQIPE